MTTGSHINFKPFRLDPSKPDKQKDYAHPHYVITSGSIIPIKVLDDVGLMREELFIDFVDIEWCLRAPQKGYEIVAINKVMIDHHLGDYAVSFMGTITRSTHPYACTTISVTPCTSIAYVKSTGTGAWWMRLGICSVFLFYMLFVKNRPTYFKYIIKGYYHG
jgi:rhamnosyltransferase